MWVGGGDMGGGADVGGGGLEKVIIIKIKKKKMQHGAKQSFTNQASFQTSAERGQGV